MTATKVGPGQYKVVSNMSVYWVDLGASGAADRCDCPGFAWRSGCRHVRFCEEIAAAYENRDGLAAKEVAK